MRNSQPTKSSILIFRYPLLTAAILFASGGLSGEVAKLEWPQFHGPSGSGTALGDKACPVEFGPSKGVEWSLNIPPGHSSPCIVGDRIFLTGFDKAAKELSTLCIDRSSGKLLWHQDRKVKNLEHTHEISNPATATPASDGRAVFVYFASYGLTAYDLTGKEIWTHPLPVAVNRMGFGSGTSPVVASGLVLLDVHAGEDSHLLAVDTDTGKPAWKAKNPLFNEGWSSPVVWQEEGEGMVGVLNASRFSARRLKDGSEKWWIPGLPNQICATPLVAGNVLYIQGVGVLGERTDLIRPPSFDKMLAQYDADKDGKIASDEIPTSLLVADRHSTGGAGNMGLRQFLLFGTGGKPVTLDRKGWDEALAGFDGFTGGDMMSTRVMAVRLGGQGDVSKTSVLWSEGKGVPEVPSSLLLENRLYLVKSGGVAICRDATTGKAIYEERLGAPGGYYASPVAAGGRIYAASDVGIVTVFSTGDTLKILAHNDLEEPIMATPALVNGRIYVRTASKIYSFR